ncbi:MAG TPA: hypothetical protein VGJ07_19645 [Rugosimonospora sp.]
MAAVLVAGLSAGTTSAHAEPHSPAASLIRVTGQDATLLPATDGEYESEDPAWVVAAPTFASPATPPADMITCGQLHRWEHDHGAIDMGGTQVMVQLWAPRTAVHVNVAAVVAHVTQRRAPFETQAIECSPMEHVPQQSELIYGDYELYSPSDSQTPKLDGYLTDTPITLALPDGSYDLGTGDTAWFPVTVQAMDGWYDWTIEVRMTVNGVPTSATASDANGHSFSTNSGFRGTWARSEAYVWCASDPHPHLEVQTAPFLCPDGL